MAFEKDYMSMTPEDAENLIASGQDTFRYKSVLVRFERDDKENMWRIYAYYNETMYLYDFGFNKKKLIGSMISKIDSLLNKGKVFNVLYRMCIIIGFILIFVSVFSLFATHDVIWLLLGVIGGVLLLIEVPFKEKSIKYAIDYISHNQANQIRNMQKNIVKSDNRSIDNAKSNIKITISKTNENTSNTSSIDYKLEALLKGNTQSEYMEAKYQLIKKLSPRDQEIATYKIIDRHEGKWAIREISAMDHPDIEKHRVADAIGDLVESLYAEDCIAGGAYILNKVYTYMNPVHLHYVLMNAINYLYGHREKEKIYREEGIRLALLDFEYRDLYEKYLFPPMSEHPIVMTTWKNGIKLLEEKGDISTALNICVEALKYNVTDGTKYGFKSTKERLQKKLTEVKEARAISYPDNKQYVFVDVETAVGFYHICSIGIIIVNGEKTEVIYQLIDPGVHIDEGNTAIHGIRDEDVLGKPNFMSFWRTIKNQINDDAIFVGHNVRFDLRKIHEDLIEFDYVFNSSKIIDTMDVAKKHHYQMVTSRGDLKLDTLANIFNINFNHHNALSDIKTTKEVLECMITKYDLNILDLEKKYNPNK